MTVPGQIKKLIERYVDNRDDYERSDYNETQARRELIDPFFKALGWDIDNEQGNAEAYKDVIHEDAIKIGAATKAPDYSFRIGGTRKFFLEAKKPAVDIKNDPDPAYQLRRYAWSAKLPLSILTNFSEFAVYDGRFKPQQTDKASQARIFYVTYEDYIEKWDEIASIFSPEAIRKGSFDRFVETNKRKKGTAEVDAAFLADIERWREDLAKNLALRNQELSTRDLNFAVQRIIDRIIFLRIAEDRGIEDYGKLRAQTNGEKVYSRLNELFRVADDRYNSGLFHFQPEAGRLESPDELTTTLSVDDKVLKEIIKGLYYPTSPYEFSVFTADILGQVYEQFLGKVISLTAGHRAKVEEKPEVKKAGGVFYTPTYIVDYIVQQTIGKQLVDKTPKQVAKLKVLDPACGSGSFLLGAYQHLLDWHLTWYAEHEPKKHAKAIHRDQRGNWRLTIAERKRILLNNIHGVDIDSQAVEVTKLSLLLKVLEGASRDLIERQMKLFHERALPDLGNNIKCGNSLIGSDFYHGRQLSLLDDEDRYRINVFDWDGKDGFPEIMKSGGFDAVIGNPPWGASFSEVELDYLRRNNREVIARMIDSYIYFINKAFHLARQSLPIGFFIPSTLLNQVDCEPIRTCLLTRGLDCIANMGQGIFGPKVLNTSTILISSKVRNERNCIVADLTKYPLVDRMKRLRNMRLTNRKAWTGLVNADPHKTFFLGDHHLTRLLGNIRSRTIKLADVLVSGIQRGVSPDVAQAHVVERNRVDLNIEIELLRPSVSGSQIRRYHSWEVDQQLIYTSKAIDITKYPIAFQHLSKFKSQNTCKEVKEGKHPFWSLHRPRDEKIFASPKLIGLTTSKKIELIYDESKSLVVTDAMYVMQCALGINPKLVMAILHSRIFSLLYSISNQGDARVIPQIKASKLEVIPFPNILDDNPTRKAQGKRICDLVDLLQTFNAERKKKKTPQEKTVVERQIDATDREIDALVYELYGLSKDEMKIVEEATAK